MISVTTKIERSQLFQEGFNYQYFTNRNTATGQFLTERIFANKTTYRKLKLTKEDLSRGKNFFTFTLG